MQVFKLLLVFLKQPCFFSVGCLDCICYLPWECWSPTADKVVTAWVPVLLHTYCKNVHSVCIFTHLFFFSPPLIPNPCSCLTLNWDAPPLPVLSAQRLAAGSWAAAGLLLCCSSDWHQLGATLLRLLYFLGKFGQPTGEMDVSCSN